MSSASRLNPAALGGYAALMSAFFSIVTILGNGAQRDSLVRADEPTATPDELEVSGTITGVDEKPVADATVEFVPDMIGSRTKVRTDKEGKYTARIRRDQNQVEIRWPGCEEAALPSFCESGIVWKGDRAVYDFPSPGRGSIRLAIVAGDGAFVPHARILVGPAPQAGPPGERSVQLVLDDHFASPAEGVYVAPSLEPGRYGILFADSQGEAFEKVGSGAWIVEIPAKPKGIGYLKLVGLVRNRRLTLRARAPKDTDVAQIRLAAVTSTNLLGTAVLGAPFEAFTPEHDGTLNLEGLAPASYHIIAVLMGIGALGEPIGDVGADARHVFPLSIVRPSAVDLVHSEEAECEIRIPSCDQKSFGSVRGRVTSRETRKPAAGVRVTVWQGPGDQG